MGAQAGQAPRAEPSAAGRDRHQLRAHGLRGAVRGPLRHHARRRHPAATRRGRAAGRHHGASAQPAALRSRTAPRRRRLRRAPAARDAAAARARGLVVPAPVVGPGRHRPLRGGGVRRVPGSLRRGLVHRQGDLRRRRVRGGAGRTRARERAAEPRSLRGRVRARRPRDRRRAVRERALALRRRRGAPAPMGARRLAAAAVDSRTARPGDRALEDAGQPPPHGVGAGDLPDAPRRVAGARRVARDVERLRARHHRRARAPAGAGRRDPPPARHLQAQPCPRGRPGPRAGRLAGRAHAHDAGVPGLADDGRDRADARSRVRVATPAAGMGDGGAGQGRAPARSLGLLSPDGRQPRARRRRGRRGGVGTAAGLAGRDALSPAVGGGARGGSLDQPAPDHRDHRAAHAGGCGARSG